MRADMGGHVSSCILEREVIVRDVLSRAEKPRVIVAPSFRSIDEIFDLATLQRLSEIAQIVWGKSEPMPRDEFLEALGDATAVVFGSWRYGTGALNHAGRDLRVIFEVAGTHDHPDLDYTACFDRGVLVGSCAPAFAPAVAEMSLALTLATFRLVARSDRDFRSGTEEYLHAGNKRASSLYAKTIGFVGCGNLSRSLQQLLEPFSVSILGYDPWLTDDLLVARGIEPVGLVEMFDRSNVVYVLATPSPHNAAMISRELMERLDHGDVLVVVSRAHLVDFDALTDLVLAGRFHVASDVFPAEPLPLDHPIRTAENAVLTAHLAGALPEALHEIGRMIVDDLLATLAGEQPTRMQYATPELIHRLSRHRSA